MTAVARIWIEYAGCVAVIGFAGARLARYGDALAALTGMSRSWIGMILVATVTSLPELVTGLSAVTLASTPDIAVGDALGSCVFNLAILAVVDIAYRDGTLFARASTVHLRSAGFGVALLAVAGLGLLLNVRIDRFVLGHVSWVSVALIAGYGVAMRSIYRAERLGSQPMERLPMGMTLRQAILGYAASGAVIVAAGIWLPLVGVQLARVMGWTDSLVGTLFIALATSVPELATTLAAARIGAVDLALGNVLGSNLFDLLIVAFDDLAFVEGPIFSAVAASHVASVVIACLMNGVVILALLFPPVNRVAHTATWAGIVLAALYAAGVALQLRHTG